MLLPRLLCVIGTVFLATTVHGFEFDLSSSEANQWTVRACDDPSAMVMPGQVPGTVHTDLMNAKQLLGDPYFRYYAISLAAIKLTKCDS